MLDDDKDNNQGNEGPQPDLGDVVTKGAEGGETREEK
jgi:hypothetical protein